MEAEAHFGYRESPARHLRGEKRVNPSPEGEQPAQAKKPKADSPSRKREAEGPPEAPEEEMVAGLPTIHDCVLACGVVAHGS